MITKDLIQCTEDMRQSAENGKITLDAQIRAYDLLEKVLDLPEGGTVGPADVYSDTVATWCSHLGPAEEFCSEFKRLASGLEDAYDEEALRAEADRRMMPFNKAVEDAARHSAEAAALHECAKETYDLWQKGGFFTRQKALKELRRRAGFRLEYDRIGNYVAKTFDLMNEAQKAFADAQQAMFAANVSYKIKPGVYQRLASVLTSVVR